jgi:hypothetical protein
MRPAEYNTVLDHLSYHAGILHTIEKFSRIREWHRSVKGKARWRGHEFWEDTWEGSTKAAPQKQLQSIAGSGLPREHN